jgi:hypothetical protein
MLALAGVVAAVAPTTAQSQAPSAPQGRRPIASPRGEAHFTFQDGKQISVDYGRPYIRNRKIMGGLVPYGQVWRTGANAATGFTTNVDLLVGGVKVPAGKYTLYTLPSEGTWKLIINRQTGQWGTEYDQAADLARIDLKKASLPQPVDQFTISFAPRGPNATTMKLEWETTSLSIDMTEAK